MIHRGVQAVGRLDQDTTGLLLLTDDGKYLQALTHPRKHVPKVYHVTTYDPVTLSKLKCLLRVLIYTKKRGICCHRCSTTRNSSINDDYSSRCLSSS